MSIAAVGVCAAMLVACGGGSGGDGTTPNANFPNLDGFFITADGFYDAMDTQGFYQRLRTVTGNTGAAYPPTNNAALALTWSVDPPLPAGLTLDPDTGRVSGALNESLTAPLESTHTFRASNTRGYYEANKTLYFNPLRAKRIQALGPDPGDDDMQFTLSPTDGTVTAAASTSTAGQVYIVDNGRTPNITLVVTGNGDGTINTIVLTAGSRVWASRPPSGNVCAGCDLHSAEVAAQKLVGFDGQQLTLEQGSFAPPSVSLQGSFNYP